MSGRRIFFTPECDIAAEKLGGYARLDPALDAFWDGLHRNPFGFDVIETEWTHQERFVVTKAFDDCPKLVWLFAILEDRSVEITHVEEYEGY